MKTLGLALAATMITSAAMAGEIGETGVWLGASVDTYYDYDTDAVNSVLTPSLDYNWNGVDLAVSTDLALVTANDVVIENAFDDVTVDLGASYAIGVNAVAYGDVNVAWAGSSAVWSGARVGVEFSF